MTRRLFVAVDLEPGARDRAAVIGADLKARIRASCGGSVRVTWVTPDRLHLTLHFIGHVEDAAAGCLISALSRPVPVPPIALELDALGLFPARGRPRVIWIGAGAGADALRRLHAHTAERLAACGCDVETRDLTPHLTLGRVRDGVLEGVELPRAAPPVRTLVTQAVLYESQLSSRGPRYTALARAPLVSGSD